MFALRWLVLACFWFWIVAVLADAMPLVALGKQLLEILVVGFFTAVLGLRVSLSARSTVKGMGATLALWLAAKIVFAIVAFISCSFLLLGAMLFYSYLASIGFTGPMVPARLAWILQEGWFAINLVCFAAMGFAFALQAALRFDRMAGRAVEGRIGQRVDNLLSGRPMAPVSLERLYGKKKAGKSKPTAPSRHQNQFLQPLPCPRVEAYPRVEARLPGPEIRSAATSPLQRSKRPRPSSSRAPSEPRPTLPLSSMLG